MRYDVEHQGFWLGVTDKVVREERTCSKCRRCPRLIWTGFTAVSIWTLRVVLPSNQATWDLIVAPDIGPGFDNPAPNAAAPCCTTASSLE
jgi:hypothetical protein